VITYQRVRQAIVDGRDAEEIDAMLSDENSALTDRQIASLREDLRNRIGVGDWVVAGTTPADRDHGHIVALDGDEATVAWVSGSTTAVDITRDDVEMYGEYSAARSRHEALDAADEVQS
jgi:hypothetical protein